MFKDRTRFCKEGGERGIPSEGHCVGKGVVVGRAGGSEGSDWTDVTALAESRAESQRL